MRVLLPLGLSLCLGCGSAESISTYQVAGFGANHRGRIVCIDFRDECLLSQGQHVPTACFFRDGATTADDMVGHYDAEDIEVTGLPTPLFGRLRLSNPSEPDPWTRDHLWEGTLEMWDGPIEFETIVGCPE
jgi:hypothetical protein